MSMSPALEKLCSFYQQLDTSNLAALADVYSQDIAFCDPAHQLKGMSALQSYFSGMLNELHSCQFQIEQVLERDGEAYLRWLMIFRHPRLKNGAEISVPGVSHVKFEDKIYYHRDYFDLGAMLYEQLPLLGKLIQFLKRRLAA